MKICGLCAECQTYGKMGPTKKKCGAQSQRFVFFANLRGDIMIFDIWALQKTIFFCGGPKAKIKWILAELKRLDWLGEYVLGQNKSRK